MVTPILVDTEKSTVTEYCKEKDGYPSQNGAHAIGTRSVKEASLKAFSTLQVDESKDCDNDDKIRQISELDMDLEGVIDLKPYRD